MFTHPPANDPRAVVQSPRAVAIGVILREHLHLAGVLTLLNLLLADACSGRIAPDYKLMALILCYVDRFPDQFHHRKEDLYLFSRMRSHGCALSTLDRLTEEHRMGGKLLTGLERCFVAYQAGLPGATSDFVDCSAAYAQFHFDHMKVEEGEVIPQAMQALTATDWVEIERAFSANSDPLRGVATESAFDALRRSILDRLPPPRRDTLSKALADIELPGDLWLAAPEAGPNR